RRLSRARPSSHAAVHSRLHKPVQPRRASGAGPVTDTHNAAARRPGRSAEMPAQQDPDIQDERVSTGNAGLDDILGGGLDADRMYLYEGRPGAGKTTLALEFLLEGARQGERVLYITLSETERELKLVARRHGW